MTAGAGDKGGRNGWRRVGLKSENSEKGGRVVGGRAHGEKREKEEDQGCNFSGNYARLRRKCQRGARARFKSRNNNMGVTFNRSRKV